MDVRLSPEQNALRDSVVSVVDRLGPRVVADLDDEGRRDRLEAAVEASGWRELRAPGVGSEPLASAVEVAVVAEELGRGLADVPFVGPTLAADLRRRCGPTREPVAGRETVLLSGDLEALAQPGRDAGAVAVDGRGAASALAVEPSPAGPRVVSVAVTPAGGGVDLTRPAGVAAGPFEPVGPIAADDLARWTALALAVASADLVGVMSGALALACAYVSERRQYGVPVGSFQAVQHLLADAHVVTEGSRSLARHAAWAVDALPVDEALAAAAGTKAYCARAARTVTETVVQVHGGIGNTWDCTAHLFLRRALLSGDLLGGVGPNLERVLAGRGIGGGPDGLR